MSDEITEDTWVETADPSHFELIGKVVIEFSRTEGLICAMFGHYCGMNEEVSRSISGRLQLRQLSEILLAVVRASQRNPSLIKDAEEIISEIAKIVEERNKIIHWEWMLGTGGPGVTKFFTAKTPIAGLPEITRFSKQELHHLISRITQTSERIMGHIMSPSEIAKCPPYLRPPTPWLGTT